MAELHIKQHLPFVTATISANNLSLQLSQILADTGSAATIFKTDDMAKLDIQIRPQDSIKQMVGIGGSEFVVEKQVSRIQIGALVASPFTIQIGALEYDFSIDGLVGLDFLLQVGATIDLKNLELR